MSILRPTAPRPLTNQERARIEAAARTAYCLTCSVCRQLILMGPIDGIINRLEQEHDWELRETPEGPRLLCAECMKQPPPVLPGGPIDIPAMFKVEDEA